MSILDAGTYRAKAVGAALCFTKAGAEQVAIEFELLDCEGYRMTYFGTFGEKALEHTIKALRTCGWQGDDLSSYEGVDANEVSLVIEHEEWEGKVSAKIRWINPVGPGGAALKAPMAPDQAKAFAAKMRGAIIGLAGPRPAVKPAARPAAAGPAPKSGLPF